MTTTAQTTVIANITPFVMKAAGEGRSQAFRSNPTAETAGAIVGVLARSLAELSGSSKLRLADILAEASKAKARGNAVIDLQANKGPKAAAKPATAPVADYKAGDDVNAAFDGESYPATVIRVQANGKALIAWASNGEESLVKMSDLQPLKLTKGDQFFLLAEDGMADEVTVRGVKGDVVAFAYVDDGSRFDLKMDEVALATKDKDRAMKAATTTKPAAKAAAPAKAAPKATTKTAAAPAKARTQTAAVTPTKGPRSASAKAAAAPAPKAAAPKATTKAATAPAKATAKPAAKTPAPAAKPAVKATTKTVAGTKGAATVTVKKGGGRGPK